LEVEAGTRTVGDKKDDTFEMRDRERYGRRSEEGGVGW